MTRPITAIVCFILIAVNPLATRAESHVPKIAISRQGIRINGSEIRTTPDGYISMDVVEKLIGKPQDVYPAGLGVRVYAWRDLGIHIQQGWRGPEKDKFFKIQLWLVNDYNKAEDKHSGSLQGHVTVEGVPITTEDTLDSLKTQLEAAGFHITNHPRAIEAKMGRISLFTVGITNKLQRLEVWCP